MEITQSNFNVVFPTLQTLLSTCDFFAVDLEMSGIFKTELAVSDIFTSLPRDFYEKYTKAARTFVPMQLGICVAHKKTDKNSLLDNLDPEVRVRILKSNNPSKDLDDLEKTLSVHIRDAARSPTTKNLVLSMKYQEILSDIARAKLILKGDAWGGQREMYTLRTFTCYLFPATPTKEDPNVEDETMGLSAETFGVFLHENGMDFNKWVRDGLRFAATENVALTDPPSTSGASGGTKWEKYASTPQPPEVYRTITSYINGLTAFAATAAPGAKYHVKGPFIQDTALYKRFEHEFTALGFSRAGPNFTFTGKEEDASGSSIVLSQKNDLGAWKGKKNMFGTRLLHALFHACSSHSKPLVLHNGMQDLYFLHRAAFRSDPATYEEYKAKIHTLFPTIFDTRGLSCLDELQNVGNLQGPLKSTHTIMSKLNTKVHIDTPAMEACGLQNAVFGSKQAHDAGYDAAMTAELFLYLRSKLRDNGSHYTKYANLVPMYGSVYYMWLGANPGGSAKAPDMLLVQEGSPAYVFNANTMGVIEKIREVFEKFGVPVGVSYKSTGYLALPAMRICRHRDSINDAAQESMAVLPSCTVHAHHLTQEFIDSLSGGRIKFFVPEK